MKRALVLVSCLFALRSGVAVPLVSGSEVAAQSEGTAIAPMQAAPAVIPPGKFVLADGSIRLPEDYRTWTHLGSWYVAEGKNGEIHSHVVYAEPDAVTEFRKTRKWPHGATIVKEVRSTMSGKLTTGPGTWDGPMQLWFVMVKDVENTFPGNPIWGRGWGWGLYLVDDPKKNTATDYKIDCIGCHIPARNTDWIFEYGYPVLNETEGQLRKYPDSIYTSDEPVTGSGAVLGDKHAP